MKLTDLVEGRGTMDPLDGASFPCFFPAERQFWNGWSCPFFTNEQAKAVLDALVKTSPDITYRVDADGSFVVSDANYPVDDREQRFGATVVTRRGEPVSLYSVGSWGWCWQEVFTEATTRHLVS